MGDVFWHLGAPATSIFFAPPGGAQVSRIRQVFFRDTRKYLRRVRLPLLMLHILAEGIPGGLRSGPFFGINLYFFYGKKCTYECALHHCTLFTFLCHGGRRLPLWRLQKKKKTYSEKGLLLDACTCGRKRAKGAVVDSPKNKSKKFAGPSE